MDVGSKHGGLASRLSNFQATHFYLFPDSKMLPDKIKNDPIFIENYNIYNSPIECNSLEGALQSLKFDKPHIAIEVCKLVGFAAKFKGKNRNKHWKSRQTLWFMGVLLFRKSEEYQRVLDFIYVSLWAQNKAFRDDLYATGSAVFTHSMGNNKESETVLTEREFCSRLTKLRSCIDLQTLKKHFNYE